MKKVYKRLAGLVQARLYCIEKDSIEWRDRHEDTIEQIIKEYMPSGSGIDSGVAIDLEGSNGNKLIFNSSFHVMDDNGYYTGWVDFKLTVKPSLANDFDLKIIGHFSSAHTDYGRNTLKSYLYDLFNTALDTKIKERVETQ